MKHILALVLAGGEGSRLNILASKRAKPALPFAGMYRIIDFTLSNIMNSDISNIGILTQYRPSSLIDHIQTGESWGLFGKDRSATILPPYTGVDESSWYEGTADAVFQNLDFIQNYKDMDNVLILSGDHIYAMDFRVMMEEHKERDADITIVAMDVPRSETSRFGIIIADKNDRVIQFEEKPKHAKSTIASLGIYMFKKNVLIEELKKDVLREHSSRDFGRDIVTNMINEKTRKIYIHRFKGYWRDVGTLQAYWDASMDVLTNECNVRAWGVRTNLNRKIEADRLPGYIGKKGNVVNSVICDGCVVNGTIERSILSPGVIVEEGAVIRDSMIFHDTHIHRDVLVDRCIVDKEVVIGNKVVLGKGAMKGKPNMRYPKHLYTGITIVGKGAHIPQHTVVGRNCILFPQLKHTDFKKKRYGNGETITQ